MFTLSGCNLTILLQVSESLDLDERDEHEVQRGKKGSLGHTERKRFEAQLRSLTSRRGDIARSMVFAIDRADAVDEVSPPLVPLLSI